MEECYIFVLVTREVAERRSEMEYKTKQQEDSPPLNLGVNAETRWKQGGLRVLTSSSKPYFVSRGSAPHAARVGDRYVA